MKVKQQMASLTMDDLQGRDEPRRASSLPSTCPPTVPVPRDADTRRYNCFTSYKDYTGGITPGVTPAQTSLGDPEPVADLPASAGGSCSDGDDDGMEVVFASDCHATSQFSAFSTTEAQRQQSLSQSQSPSPSRSVYSAFTAFYEAALAEKRAKVDSGGGGGGGDASSSRSPTRRERTTAADEGAADAERFFDEPPHVSSSLLGLAASAASAARAEAAVASHDVGSEWATDVQASVDVELQAIFTAARSKKKREAAATAAGAPVGEDGEPVEDWLLRTGEGYKEHLSALRAEKVLEELATLQDKPSITEKARGLTRGGVPVEVRLSKPPARKAAAQPRDPEATFAPKVNRTAAMGHVTSRCTSGLHRERHERAVARMRREQEEREVDGLQATPRVNATTPQAAAELEERRQGMGVHEYLSSSGRRRQEELHKAFEERAARGVSGTPTISDYAKAKVSEEKDVVKRLYGSSPTGSASRSRSRSASVERRQQQQQQRQRSKERRLPAPGFTRPLENPEPRPRFTTDAWPHHAPPSPTPSQLRQHQASVRAVRGQPPLPRKSSVGNDGAGGGGGGGGGGVVAAVPTGPSP
eukprot:Rhum_TRINITY_DN15185_c5_g1::Rhum_TRINITY_DN15185_c5_g1_i1::g.142871::m.142871